MISPPLSGIKKTEERAKNNQTRKVENIDLGEVQGEM